MELMLLSVLSPLVAFALAAVPARGRWPMGLLPLSPLPALLLALFAPAGQVELPGLLLGGAWVLDDIRRTFLVLTAALWLVAGLYAVGYVRVRQRFFRVFWLLTLTGNLGLILAADIAGFYSFFALMTFSAYGLIVHAGNGEAWRAGRIYLIMAVLGEILLLTGFLLAAHQADSLVLADLPAAIAGAPEPAWPAALLALGLGVKAGLPLLHFWLPLAHPVAPTPASAVLSGAMIKAGLLGWLLVLPLGAIAAPGWAAFGVNVGVLAALGAALIGVTQNNPKTVLAYSSISQMGLMTMLVSAALASPAAAGVLVPVVALYALHHGLAKGALFLATGLNWPRGRTKRAWLWLPVVAPGLALAGLPWTSGAAAKLAAKQGLAALPEAGLPAGLAALLTAGAGATLVLVLRFVQVLARERASGTTHPLVASAWAVVVAASLVLFWWLPWPDGLDAAGLWDFKTKEGIKLTLPLLAGLALFLMARFARWQGPSMPAGDGVVLLESLVRCLRQGWTGLATVRLRRPPVPAPLRLWGRRAEAMEFRFRREAGGLLLTLLILMGVLVLGGIA